MRATELIVLILEGYAVAGLIFAAAFASTDINRLDLAARQDSTPVNRNLNWERLR